MVATTAAKRMQPYHAGHVVKQSASARTVDDFPVAMRAGSLEASGDGIHEKTGLLCGVEPVDEAGFGVAGGVANFSLTATRTYTAPELERHR